MSCPDWLIARPDPALQILEGQYDNRPKPERPFTAQELADAKRVRANAMGCPHNPLCADYTTCVHTIIRKWRGEAVAS